MQSLRAVYDTTTADAITIHRDAGSLNVSGRNRGSSGRIMEKYINWCTSFRYIIKDFIYTTAGWVASAADY